MKNICIQEGLSFLEEIPIGSNAKNHFQRVSINSYKGESLVVFTLSKKIIGYINNNLIF